MAIGENVGLFKIVGAFGLIILLIIWGGGIFVGLAKAVKTGDWTDGLKETGGRIFALDSTLNKEVDLLLSPNEEANSYEKSFHIAFSLSLLFMLFLTGFLLFRLGNWMIGIKSFSPSSDVFLIALIILIFLALQFLYTYLVLDETIIPMSGVWRFVSNLPNILNVMIS